jgi:hypothetical protein
MFEPVVSSKLADHDHNVFKLGHFPIVHFKTSNYYSFPYQKVSTFKACNSLNSSKWHFEAKAQAYNEIPTGDPLLGFVAHR